MIFTDRFLTIANHATGAVWKHPWRDIAWCELSDHGGVLIHLYRDDAGESKGTLLKVEDADTAYEIYELVGGVHGRRNAWIDGEAAAARTMECDVDVVTC